MVTAVASEEPVSARLPVVILTASGDDDDAILACYGAGANDLLPKPATRSCLNFFGKTTTPPRACVRATT